MLCSAGSPMNSSSTVNKRLRRITRLAWHFMCAALVVFTTDAAYANQADALSRSLDGLASSLPQPARTALAQIPDLKRRLLAARSYAKAGNELTDKWSWSQAEIQAFEASPEYQRMQAAVNELTREFERQNPGYSLYTNTQVRSLDLQIERWNSNRGVQATAEQLFQALTAHVNANEGHVSTPQQLRTLLVEWHPSTAAPLAAPGLSAHGQLRALDFQIVRGSQVVAGTSIDSVVRVWEREGWASRLHQAVVSIKAHFEGPLRSPNEPWHYRYVP
jgi:hypothetical protein